MFDIIKSKVNILDYLVKELGVTFKTCGENTYQIEDEENNGGCFMCHHNNCLKIKHDEDSLKDSFYHCFSCEGHGSVIDAAVFLHKLNAVDAARKLAEEYKIPLPNGYSPLQEIFDVAAGYYHNGFVDFCNKPQMKLSKMTPLEYQQKVRKHKPETLEYFKVGYSDGKLVEFLESFGYSEELLLESGLKSKKTGKDFLPQDCFIYPHYVNGKVSHFTFKDSLKKLAYQLPNKHVLNGATFYNQDSLKKFETIIVVEGENDLLSVFENTTKYGVIGTIGQISGSQLDWMRENLSSKNVITIFDADEAGDKYRTKVEKIRGSFKSLTQVKPDKDKDIDDLLTGGADLDEVIEACRISVEVKSPYQPPKALLEKTNAAEGVEGEDSEVESENDDKHFIQKFGAYYTIKYKEGVPEYTKVSNFILELKNVYLTEDNDRIREIVVAREDGYRSEPILINSETKVSLRLFRVLLARSADADFTGSEHNLISMWKHVYSKNREILVKVLKIVGRHERSKSWILSNKFIPDGGSPVDPDENGVFWLKNGNETLGVKAEKLDKSAEIQGDTGIPNLNSEMSEEESDELLGFFIKNLAKNLGDMGPALLLTAWMNAVAYSNTLFWISKGFPMLFIWSTNGMGKGTIGSWLMSMYDMMPHGKTTVSQLKSGVGFGRKAEYYGSLPLWIDEIRADRQTHEYEGIIRSYFDRDGRTLGAKDGGTLTIPIRSCIMLSGEDHFQDPATKERCITVRLAKLGRETVESFRALDSRCHEFSSIGYKWILESSKANMKDLVAEVKDLDLKLITQAGCTSRKSKLWSIVGLFALKLGQKYAPDFDMEAHLFKVAAADSSEQKSETTLAQFFERVESIMSQEGHPKITNNHIIVDGNMLHIWFPHVYRVVNESCNGSFAFTKSAVVSALREESYFVSDNKKISMGGNGVRRICVTLDLDKAPDTIKNIAQMH